MYTILFVCALFSSAYSQIYDIGKCPPSQKIIDLDLEKFYGKWYEVARVDNGPQKGGQCVTHTISPNVTNNVGHSHTLKSLDGNNRAYFFVSNIQLFAGDLLIDYEYLTYSYNVIDTDYDNYAVVLSCVEYPPLGYWYLYLTVRTRIAWILSRTPTMDAQLETKLVKKLATYGIGKRRLIYTNKGNCPAGY